MLVVDDSAMVRQVLSTLLSQEPGFKVTTASTGPIAFTKMAKSRPDVIVLDLEMPEMHGLTFLEKVMTGDPIPVVICSGQATRGSDRALKALELGAVDIINKPQIGVQEFLFESALRIIDTVKAAAQARLRLVRAVSASGPVPMPRPITPPAARPVTKSGEKVVVIGASTGGTEALLEVLRVLPPDAPGIAVVQHMPEGFTAAFAARLNELCQIEVIEGTTGDEVRRGRAIIAPGDKHLLLHRRGDRFVVETAGGPLVSRHRPSCDVLFRSAARSAGPQAMGVIMTGMGSDGAEGLGEMRKSGAVTIAQNQATCVVFGMPKVAIDQGAVSKVLALSAIPAAILHRAR